MSNTEEKQVLKGWNFLCTRKCDWLKRQKNGEGRKKNLKNRGKEKFEKEDNAFRHMV